MNFNRTFFLNGALLLVAGIFLTMGFTQVMREAHTGADLASRFFILPQTAKTPAPPIPAPQVPDTADPVPSEVELPATEITETLVEETALDVEEGSVAWAAPDSPQAEWIRRLAEDSSPASREALKRQLIQADPAFLETLIPALASSEPAVVKTLAEVFAIHNLEPSLDALTARAMATPSQDLRRNLLQCLGKFTAESAASFLNRAFLDASDPVLLAEISRGLLGRASAEVLEKSRALLEGMEDHSLPAAHLHRMLASMGHAPSLGIARDNLDAGPAALSTLAVQTLQYSTDPQDLETLLAKRRSFYRELPLMEAFLQTRLVLATRGLQGRERLDQMVQLGERNQVVLAWLAWHLATLGEAVDPAWMDRFLREHPLRDHESYLRACIRFWGGIQPPERASRDASLYAPRGALRMADTLLGDRILLDGAEWRPGPDGLYTAAAGEHLLTLQRSGFAPLEVQVTVRGNQILAVTLAAETPRVLVWNSLDMPLSYIPPGTFVMGHQKTGFPERRVHLMRGIYVGVYEVRNMDYEMFNPGHHGNRDRRSPGDTHPVIMVSWYEAVDFCNRLSLHENLEPCYNRDYGFNPQADGYRLLTEAEWEFAARGGGERVPYATGQSLVEDGKYLANFATREHQADGFVFTAPVGSFPANPMGLHDMTGNVSEWCHDWYQTLAAEAKPGEALVLTDPLGPLDGSSRVVRGGSFETRIGLSVYHRQSAHPADRAYSRGFRVARTAMPVLTHEIRGYSQLTPQPADTDSGENDQAGEGDDPENQHADQLGATEVDGD